MEKSFQTSVWFFCFTFNQKDILRKLLFLVRFFIYSLYKFISRRSLFFTFVSKLKRQRNLLQKIYGSNIPLNIAKFEIPNSSLQFPLSQFCLLFKLLRPQQNKLLSFDLKSFGFYETRIFIQVNVLKGNNSVLTILLSWKLFISF